MKSRLKEYPAREDLLEHLEPYHLLRRLRERVMPDLDWLQNLLLGLRRDPLPPDPAERRTKNLSCRWELDGQWPKP